MAGRPTPRGASATVPGASGDRPAPWPRQARRGGAVAGSAPNCVLSVRSDERADVPQAPREDTDPRPAPTGTPGRLPVRCMTHAAFRAGSGPADHR